MTEEEIRNLIREYIKKCIEEDSAFATSDSAGVGSGEAGNSTDPSYVHRQPVGKVQTRPYPSLIGTKKKKRRKRK